VAKKRGAGEGNIYQRSDGRWEARISLGYANGKRVRKSYFGATQAAVEDQLLKARSDLSRGLPVGVEHQTVKDFLDRWLDESVKPSVRPATHQQYHQHVRLYLGPSLGKHALLKLSPLHVLVFVNERLKSGLSPRTVQLSLVILRHALDTAMKWNLVGRNVAKLVDSPKVRHHQITPLDPVKARKFLDATKGERLEALYGVALGLGLREGEALGLRWADIDLEGSQISIHQTLQRVGGKRFGTGKGKLLFTEPKTDRSRRTLRIPGTLIKALRVHRVRQKEECLAAGSAWKDNGLVFTTKIGTPLEGRSAVTDFKRLLEKANKPEIDAKIPMSTRFHDLRHSAASLLLAQGVQLRAIMELLGHSTIALTANTYSHVMPSMMQDMADKMDAILTQ
jgi:integrase